MLEVGFILFFFLRYEYGYKWKFELDEGTKEWVNSLLEEKIILF